MLRYKTEIAWFSRLVQHLARIRNRSILTTLEPARGLTALSATLKISLPKWQIYLCQATLTLTATMPVVPLK